MSRKVTEIIMALYAMGDMHLSFGIKDKPMDIFGDAWQGYMEKLSDRCRAVLKEDDLLLLVGDLSWATYMEQATADFEFVESLPGKKIISKGNHDYWWDTLTKLNKYKKEKNLSSIDFLHNNFFVYEDYAICGNRGWIFSSSQEDIKIYERELSRLEFSLLEAEKAGFNKKIVMTHFPPLPALEAGDGRMVDLMKKYGVEQCVYGHLHNINPKENHSYLINGIRFRLVASDYLEFAPLRIL